MTLFASGIEGEWSPSEALAKEGSLPAQYVHLLQSITDPRRRYVGRSADYVKRLAEHNASSSPHTKKHQP